MATLNLKNFPDDLRSRLQEMARRDRRSLAQEVIYLLEKASERREMHSILELSGLGKEVWQGIDADEYVRAERDSWDS